MGVGAEEGAEEGAAAECGKGGVNAARCDPLRLYTDTVISVPLDIHKSKIHTHGYP